MRTRTDQNSGVPVNGFGAALGRPTCSATPSPTAKPDEFVIFLSCGVRPRRPNGEYNPPTNTRQTVSPEISGLLEKLT